MTDGTPVTKNLEENEVWFRSRCEGCSDIKLQPMRLGKDGSVSALAIYVENTVPNLILEESVLGRMFIDMAGKDPKEVYQAVEANSLGLSEAQPLQTREEGMNAMLAGNLLLLVEGYDKGLKIGSKGYPARSVDNTDTEKVLRGSNEGFTESVKTNTALIRRRIRNPKLSMEMKNVGSTSHTDVVLCYMEDRVDSGFLQQIEKRLEQIRTDALAMNQESLAECLYPHKWYNPFPKFKYTERPDTAAAEILDGKIVLLTDNSPAVMILPVSVFDIMEEADDFYFPPVTGTYLRVTRFVIALLTLLLTPTWLLFLQNPQWIPPQFAFIKISGDLYVPVFAQLLILEFAIDGLKLAAINTPGMLTTPLSVIAGLVVGEFAVQSGWFNAETMLYMAFVAIANYTQASYELGYALKFMRILLLILTAVFGLAGYAAGLVITFLSLLLNRTVSGESYLYPLIPFDGKQFCRRIFRKRIRFNINLKE